MFDKMFKFRFYYVYNNIDFILDNYELKTMEYIKIFLKKIE